MLKRLYDWIIKLSSHKHAMWYLAAVAFAESSFFPLPPDPMVAAMSLANRKKAFTVAAVCTVSSVVGGFLGYYIGYALYEALGAKIVHAFGSEEAFIALKMQFHKWGFWIIALKGFTPIPFKLVTIASGVVHFDLLTFTLASIITRGGRFFIVATLLWYYGEPVKTFIEKNLTLVTMSGLGLLLAGFAIVKCM